jgi:hypothetical protein
MRDAERRIGDRQVGTARLFESCGFRKIASPSPNRALMRLEF